MKNVIICDLDGTLADISHRRHFVEKPVPFPPGWRADWDAFHAACVDDAPKQDVIRVLDMLTDGLGEYSLWIVSGRSEAVRAETEKWLAEHVWFYDRLVMRPVGDFTPDHVLKHRWLKGYLDRDDTRVPPVLPPVDQILCVLDDRDRVVKMWRDAGLTCLQVAPGNF